MNTLTFTTDNFNYTVDENEAANDYNLLVNNSNPHTLYKQAHYVTQFIINKELNNEQKWELAKLSKDFIADFVIACEQGDNTFFNKYLNAYTYAQTLNIEDELLLA